ncbi:MAG: hypothetical protein FJZ56_05745 [Chlamydiae bacterium]|nr:hypothetical protein [Chlamydiota bacterium]
MNSKSKKNSSPCGEVVCPTDMQCTNNVCCYADLTGCGTSNCCRDKEVCCKGWCVDPIDCCDDQICQAPYCICKNNIRCYPSRENCSS